MTEKEVLIIDLAVVYFCQICHCAVIHVGGEHARTAAGSGHTNWTCRCRNPYSYHMAITRHSQRLLLTDRPMKIVRLEHLFSRDANFWLSNSIEAEVHRRDTIFGQVKPAVEVEFEAMVYWRPSQDTTCTMHCFCQSVSVGLVICSGVMNEEQRSRREDIATSQPYRKP